MGTSMIPVLQIIIYLILAVMIGLIALYVYLMRPQKAKRVVENDDMIEVDGGEKTREQNYGKFTGNLTRESIFEFMEFDEIVDFQTQLSHLPTLCLLPGPQFLHV